MSKRDVKCQVLCCTYNHKNFIKDALDGFIMQKTNFPFEVLVGDDCSTDGTSDIVAEYAQKYPEIIKHIKREKNLGGQENSFDLLRKIDADYLALCEGDDYWTDPNKLQKQIDFLESNKQLNGCFHNAEIIKEPGVKSWNFDFNFPPDENGKQDFKSNKKIFTMDDIIGGIIPTASIVYRYDKTIKYPEWFKTCVAGDRPMHCFMLKSGGFGYINETMSVYRVSPSGSWFKKNGNHVNPQETADWIELLTNIDNYFDNKFSAAFEQHKEATFNTAMTKALKQKDIEPVSVLIKKYPKYFYKFLKIKNNNSSYNKTIYKVIGIPVWKIIVRGNNISHYLFGLIKIIEAKKY